MNANFAKRGTRLIPVGGISAQSISAYLAAGAFGIGSTLYSLGKSVDRVRASAEALVRAVGQAHA